MESRTAMREFAASVLAFLAVAVVGCASAQENFRPSGIYSNLSYSEEGGDLVGMELLIFPAEELAASDYVVFIQIAEGGAPYTALVPLEIRGNEISLVLPSNGSYSKVQLVGNFRGDDLEIRWPHGALEHLKRGHSYWE